MSKSEKPFSENENFYQKLEQPNCNTVYDSILSLERIVYDVKRERTLNRLRSKIKSFRNSISLAFDKFNSASKQARNMDYQTALEYSLQCSEQLRTASLQLNEIENICFHALLDIRKKECVIALKQQLTLLNKANCRLPKPNQPNQSTKNSLTSSEHLTK